MVTQVVLQLVFIALLARLLSKEDFGVMAVALAVVGFIEIFSQIGIGPALIQRKDLSQTQINGAFFISIFLGIVFTALIYFLAPVVADYYEHEELTNILRVIGISFMISAISIVPRSLIIKKMEFKKLFIAAAFAMTIGNLCVGLGMAYSGYGLWAYVFALLVQNLIMSICYWIQNPIRISWNLNWSGTRSMIRYGGQSTLFNIFNYAATKADTLIVAKLSSLNMEIGDSTRWSSTGIYDRAVWLQSLPITVLGKLSDSVMFSGLSHIQEEKEKLRRVFLSGTYLISMVIFPACVFMIFFAPEIVMLILHDEWPEVVNVVRIFFIGVSVRSLIKLSDATVRALDAVFKASIIKFLFLILVCLAAYIGIHFGLEQVAALVVVATVLQYILMTRLSMSLIDLNFSTILKKMVPGMTLGLVTAAICCPVYFLIDLLETHYLLSLLISTSWVGLSLAILAWYFPWLYGKGRDNVLLFLLEKFPKKKALDPLRRRLRL